MRPVDVRNRLRDQPFRPFRMHLSDGTAVDVVQPGMLILGPSSLVLPTRFIRDEEGEPLAARWQTVALAHIVRFTNLDRSSNGRSGLRR